VNDNLHRVTSRLLSWGRVGGAKRFHFGASPRSRISRFGGGLVLASVSAKLHVAGRGANVIDCRKPDFPRNICRMNYIRKILEQGVIATAPGEVFNVAAVR
jgi:hypothetical protein